MEGRGIYHDLKRGTSCSCFLELEAQTLAVYPVQYQNEKLLWEISRFNSCTFIEPTLHIRYGDYLLECSGDLAEEIHKHYRSAIPTIPPEPSSQRTRILSAAGYTGLLLVTGYFLWFVFMPWLGEKAATLIPVDLEVKWGEKLSATFVEGYEENDSSGYYLQKFVNALDLDKTYTIKARVLQSDEINAYALPGGNIFVYTAILEHMNSYEELVALLGHEVSHIQNRHSLKSICRAAANSLLLSGLFGGMNGLGSSLLEQVGRFRELNYSRELETEADNAGLGIMSGNRVNPLGMIKLLQLLKKESVETPGLMKYLSTHPDTDARIINIAQKTQGLQRFSQNKELTEIFKNLQKALANGK